MKHILVISQYFYPESFRINDICEEWVKRGYKVTVITGIPNYPEGKFFDGYGLFAKQKDSYKGVSIIRLPIIPRGTNVISLVFNYISFVISGFFWNIFTNIRADYVFIFEVSPMTQALPGIWYASRTNIPCYLYVQDLWPENVEVVTGIKNRALLNIIGRMVDYIYAKCTKIFATSDSFVDSIVSRGVSPEKVTKWYQYAEDFYKPIDKQILDSSDKKEEFKIIFTGNVGIAQGLEILPKVAQKLKNEKIIKKIKFKIVGDGRFKEELITQVKQLGVEEYFTFSPRIDPVEIPLLISNADAAFLSFSENILFEKTIPAKLQSYFACGIPVIGSVSGESRKIILEANAGICSELGDVDGLANAIIEMKKKTVTELNEFGQNARKYYDENFDKNKLMNEIERFLKS